MRGPLPASWGCLALAAMLAVPVSAATVVPSLYQSVALAQGVPSELLFVMALKESGARLVSGRVMPWPWTLNVAGEPRRFPSRHAAWHELQAAIAAGQSVDVGLGQINWRYHRARLANDPWRAFEPQFNLQVAAALLRQHFEQRGDWWAAAGAYHSPGTKPAQQERARRYADDARRRYRQLFGDPPWPAPAPATALPPRSPHAQ